MTTPHPPGLSILAMGGHSLLAPNLPPTVENQFDVTRHAVIPIADLIERQIPLVITHGNGPQVGFMQLRAALARRHIHEVPLDSLVADTQGAIGYMIQLALRNELLHRGVDRPLGTVVTEVEVDAQDPAMENPEKPVGVAYTPEEAEEQRQRYGWVMRHDAQRGWRRVVPSPKPLRIVQLPLVASLVELGVTVIACGGGGIPVTRDADGMHHGIEAVIDKDRTSALLGISLGAERLIITTAVDRVYVDYGKPNARALDHVGIDELMGFAAAGQFPAGSMGPKIEAAATFLRGGGRSVIICHPDDLAAALDGRAGTTITSAPA